LLGPRYTECRLTDYATALQQWLAGTDASGERAAARKSARAGFVTRSPAQRAALERVRAWTRERFSLGDDVALLVTELACTLPGCPPRETVVAFWTAEDRRHHFKVFKPVAEVVPDNLPPAWLKDALVIPPGGDCDCC
jgi:nitrate reductase delta subunit